MTLAEDKFQQENQTAATYTSLCEKISRKILRWCTLWRFHIGRLSLTENLLKKKTTRRTLQTNQHRPTGRRDALEGVESIRMALGRDERANGAQQSKHLRVDLFQQVESIAQQ